MNSEDAIDAVAAGRAVLFAGAGFSLGAKAGADEIPSAKDLGALMMTAIKSDERPDYTLAAELFVANKDESALQDFLREALTATSVTKAQEAISSQPWRKIYTTNFDNVIELARKNVGLTYDSLTPKDRPPAAGQRMPIVHLHGYIGESAADQHGIDLARSKLVSPAIQRTTWPTQLQVDIEAASAIFIVGYSISDFHIAQLIKSTANVRNKTFIVIEENPSHALSAYLSRFGTVMPIGLENLSARISSAARDNTSNLATSEISCFELFDPSEPSRVPTTEDTIALLLNGIFDDAAYSGGQIEGAPPYSFARRRASQLASSNANQATTVVLQSRIGNGKTMCLRQIERELTASGVEVWQAKYPLPTIIAELDIIRATRKRRAYVFDITDGFEAAISNVSQNLLAGDVLVVTTRLVDAGGDESPIRRMLPGGFVRYDLNTLSEEEIVQIERWISYYGLWGNTAGSSQASRVRHIREQCGREIRSVVISLFQHGSLEERIKQGLRDIEAAEEGVRIAFACLLIARFGNCPLDFFDVSELADVEPYATMATLAQVGGGEFVEVRTGDFDIRSPILAEFLLARCLPVELVFSAIVTMIDALTTLQGADWRYEESLPSLMKFSIISKIFPDTGRRKFVVPLYEHLLRHRMVRSNPHFWLQFAMARLEMGEFELTQKCLENAYTEARKRGSSYRLYMLDNQKVKFLLKSRMSSDAYDDKAAAFSEAVTLFATQVRSVQGGIDVHVLRLVEPLIQYRELFKSLIPKDVSDRLQRDLSELGRRVRSAGDMNSSTAEEQRLLALLPR